MTTATRETIKQAARLSAAELDDLAAWPRERRVHAGENGPADSTPRPEPAPSPRPDFAARLQAIWGDAPSLAQNAVVAAREEERF